MRILVIPQYAPTGGALTWLLNLLELHRARGFETALLIERRTAWPEIIERFQAAGARLFHYPDHTEAESNSFFCAMHDLRRYLPAYLRFRPHLTIVSNTASVRQYGAFLLPGPLAFFMHTCPHAALSRRQTFFPLLLAGRRKRFATVSRFAANSIVEHLRLPASVIDVIPSPCRPADKRAPLDGALVLSAGHVDTHKNPDVWLETTRLVLKRFPAARFVWIGDGLRREEYIDKIRQEGLADRVEMPGHMDNPAEWYARAAVFFHPSLVESQGLVVLDAMAAGLPCVTSNAGGLPESVADGETGFLLAPDDAEGFAARLSRLLGDEPLRRAMGNAGQERAMRLFSPALHRERILELYRRLTGRN